MVPPWEPMPPFSLPSAALPAAAHRAARPAGPSARLTEPIRRPAALAARPAGHVPRSIGRSAIPGPIRPALRWAQAAGLS